MDRAAPEVTIRVGERMCCGDLINYQNVREKSRSQQTDENVILEILKITLAFHCLNETLQLIFSFITKYRIFLVLLLGI